MTSAPSPRTPLNAVLQETDEAQDSVVAVEELNVHCPVTAHDADSCLLTSPRVVPDSSSISLRSGQRGQGGIVR